MIAGGPQHEATVMPFILRGVNRLGIAFPDYLLRRPDRSTRGTAVRPLVAKCRDPQPFVVITPGPINALGLVMTVPVTSAGAFARARGLTVPIRGTRISGVAICNQVRTFDLAARTRAGSARFVECVDEATATEIVARVLSVIEPLPWSPLREWCGQRRRAIVKAIDDQPPAG